ncbi:MAG: putative cytokinetic ring protein SteA [Nocardioides sp.]
MKTSIRPSRRRPSEILPGVHGTARVDRRVAALLPRLRPGDVAVLDVLDLDRPTAQALVDAKVAVVVDTSAAISGRYPNLGPELLAAAGIVLLDQVGGDALIAIKDGSKVRVHDGAVHVGDRAVAVGRELDCAAIEREMTAARQGMVAQLQTFTHTSSEFLRREQDLLLHGIGLPELRTRLAGCPVVVVADARQLVAQRKRLKAFFTEQHPVLVGVDAGADALLDAGYRPQVVVVSAGAEPPSTKALKGADDVVLVVEPGASRAVTERFERLGARPHRLETTATAQDAALLLAHGADARVIVEVGTQASLEEFLDRGRSGLASTYLTRLAVGSRLVDSAAVPTLYSGKVRPRHLLLALLLCLVAVAAAIASTPVGHDWAVNAQQWITDTVQGWTS